MECQATAVELTLGVFSKPFPLCAITPLKGKRKCFTRAVQYSGNLTNLEDKQYILYNNCWMRQQQQQQQQFEGYICLLLSNK